MLTLAALPTGAQPPPDHGPAVAAASTAQPLAGPSTPWTLQDIEPPPAGAVALSTLVNAPTAEVAYRVKHHYMWSNERRHDIFFNDIKELGGGYIGVGGDQNYSLAAAARAEVLWLIDLDAAVVRMHQLYTALILAAPTAAAFMKLMEPRAAPRVEAAVAAHYSEEERQAILQLYNEYGEDLHRYLRRTYRIRPAGRRVNWLSNDSMYQHIRQLAQRGQLITRVGNLAGPTTMLEIAAAARRAGVQVSALYLSNAESWFRYTDDFRRNLGALPWDDRGVVLRTVKSDLLSYAHGDVWHFCAQRGTNFVRKLTEPRYRSVEVAMLDAVVAARPQGLSHIGFGDADSDGAVTKALAAALPTKPRRKHDEKAALLAAGLVTRPAGNRVHASVLDAEHYARAERSARRRLRASGAALIAAPLR